MDNRLKVVNHVVALLVEAFEVAEQIRNAPESPVTSYLPAGLRRTFRRNARRIRRGMLQPLYLNLYTPKELAIILERTAARDEAIERGLVKLTRITQEIARVMEYQREELEEGTRVVYALARQRALEDGPDSKAAEFLRIFNELIVKGRELRTLKRRRKEPATSAPFTPPGADPHRLECDSIRAAQILTEPPGEKVLRFSMNEIETAEPPVVMRIGIGGRSWVGSFQRGTTECCTVQLMPGGAHLLVVSYGAAYIIEAVTCSLACIAGSDVTDVINVKEGGLRSLT